MINRMALKISSESGVTPVSSGRKVMRDGDSRAASGCESRMPDCLIRRHFSLSGISTRGLTGCGGDGADWEGGTSGMDARLFAFRWRAMLNTTL